MNIRHLITDDLEIEVFERISKYMTDEFIHTFKKTDSEPSSVGTADVLHAHSWMATGTCAAELSARLKIPYVVTLSQNDIKAYGRVPFFKKKNACSILENASKVIFANPSQQNFIAGSLPSDIANRIFEHGVLLIEPVRDFWIKNIRIHPPTALVHIKLLYVGELDEDSQITTILNAVDKLKKKNYQVSFTAVETESNTSNFRGKVLALSSKRDDFQVVTLFGDTTEDYQKLLDIYRDSDIMLLLNRNSVTIERFAEASTQGLPVIHARESAFSEILSDKLTEFEVSHNNASEIADTILRISDSFATIEQHLSNFHPFLMFDARETAYRYQHLYDNVCIKQQQ